MSVLLVVASSALERQLTDFFSSRGRQVAVCSSSEQAREQLESQFFTYVLIDLETDDSTVELCRHIRELPEEERAYCLVLPAAETVQAMRPALAAGADDYLPKPVDSAALQLRLALGDRRLATGQKLQKRRAEESVLYREQYFRSLLENASDLLTIVDGEGHILYQTPSSERLLGWNSDEMMGWNLIEHVHPEDRERVNDALAKAVRELDTTPSVQYRLRRRSGDFRSFEALFKNLLTDSVIGGVVISSRDISEHRRLESELKRERAFFQQLFRNSPTGIVILDPEGRVIDANSSFLELFGYQLAEIKRRSVNELIVPEELLDEAQRLWRSVSNKESNSLETSRKRRDGSVVEVSIIAFPIEISSRLIGAFSIYSDITQRKKFERELFHSAYHDPLTGLPNRALLVERIERALREVKRRPEYLFGLLFIDLDRFKVINDSLGHEAGDELLKEMARRLEECVRPGDITARLGGDEFTIILQDLRDPRDAGHVCDRILAALARPFEIAGQEIGNSGSIGIAYGSPRYQNADELLRDADLAMYKAKTGGKARYATFDADMHKRAMWRLQLETHLRRAIENEEMVLYYQPIVSLATRRVRGFEALVRWAHPKGGIVAARELIPICEETGLIVPLGRWVLRQAMRQAVSWQSRFPDHDCLVNVNLSAKETTHPDFLKEIDAICRETGVHPGTIGLEMTESLMVSSDEKIVDTLWELRKRGFRLYVDDFGTGHASLSALARFPIDALKIDRSFVQQLTPAGGHLEIVQAIAALGETMGLSLVAEGVESREQLAQILRLEFNCAQGFLFSKPLPRERVEQLLIPGPLWKDAAEGNEEETLALSAESVAEVRRQTAS